MSGKPNSKTILWLFKSAVGKAAGPDEPLDLTETNGVAYKMFCEMHKTDHAIFIDFLATVQTLFTATLSWYGKGNGLPPTVENTEAWIRGTAASVKLGEDDDVPVVLPYKDLKLNFLHMQAVYNIIAVKSKITRTEAREQYAI